MGWSPCPARGRRVGGLMGWGVLGWELLGWELPGWELLGWGAMGRTGTTLPEGCPGVTNWFSASSTAERKSWGKIKHRESVCSPELPHGVSGPDRPHPWGGPQVIEGGSLTSSSSSPSVTKSFCKWQDCGERGKNSTKRPRTSRGALAGPGVTEFGVTEAPRARPHPAPGAPRPRHPQTALCGDPKSLLGDPKTSSAPPAPLP